MVNSTSVISNSCLIHTHFLCLTTITCNYIYKPSNQIWLYHQKNGWKLCTHNRYIMPNRSKCFGSRLRVSTFKLQLKLWCHKSEPMKAYIIGRSHGHPLNECIVMSYYLLPPVSRHVQPDLFSYHNYNGGLWLANQKPNTLYIISQKNIWNVEIANLTAQNYTLWM